MDSNDHDFQMIGGTRAEMMALAARIMERPCPDCFAEVTLRSTAHTTFLHVAHDDTCPSLLPALGNRAARRRAARRN